MLDQDSGDDDDNNTIRLRYLYRGEHKRDGRVATIACENGTVKQRPSSPRSDGTGPSTSTASASRSTM